MTPASISLSHAKARLSALVNEVAYGHKHFVILSHGRAKARLVPVEEEGTAPDGARGEFAQTQAAAKRLINKIRKRGIQFGSVRELESLRLEEDLARWAKINPAEENSGISKKVSELLDEMKAQREGYQAAMKSFLSRGPFFMSKPGEKYPSREEIHERHPLR